MSRLIDADALSRIVKLAWETSDSEDFEKSVFIAIATAPTIEERKTGKWILDEDPHDGDCRCSVCHIAIDQMHERNHGLLNALTGGKWWTFYKFCPTCGADMRG